MKRNKLKLRLKLNQIKENEAFICSLSYCTIMGWIAAFILQEEKIRKNDLCGFHLRQSLGLFILSSIIYLILSIIGMLGIFPSFTAFFIPIFLLIQLYLHLFGIIRSIQYRPIELPIIGGYISTKLSHVFERSNLNLKSDLTLKSPKGESFSVP